MFAQKRYLKRKVKVKLPCNLYVIIIKHLYSATYIKDAPDPGQQLIGSDHPNGLGKLLQTCLFASVNILDFLAIQNYLTICL